MVLNNKGRDKAILIVWADVNKINPFENLKVILHCYILYSYIHVVLHVQNFLFLHLSVAILPSVSGMIYGKI